MLTAVSLPKLLAVTGLGLDIIGAIVLASGLVTKSHKQIYLEASARTGWNYDLVRALVEKRRDGFSGLIILGIGFFLQFLSYWVYDTVVSTSWLLLVVLLLMMLLLRRYYVGEEIAKIIAVNAMVPGDIENERVPGDIAYFGKTMNCPRVEGETNSQWWERIRAKVLSFTPLKCGLTDPLPTIPGIPGEIKPGEEKPTVPPNSLGRDEAIFKIIAEEAAGLYKLIVTVATSFLGANLFFRERIAPNPSSFSSILLWLSWVLLICAILAVMRVRRLNIESGRYRLEGSMAKAKAIDEKTRFWSDWAGYLLAGGLLLMSITSLINSVG